MAACRDRLSLVGGESVQVSSMIDHGPWVLMG